MHIIKTILNNFDERSKVVHINTLFMLVLRGINIIISFLYVPLLINSLNTDNYGIWLTLTSIVAWFHILDIGLGNGLRNKLTESLANNNTILCRQLISTTYISVGVFTLITGILFIPISSIIDWSILLNVDREMLPDLIILVNCVVLLFLVQIFLSLINSVLLAFQKPAISSLITTLGQLISYLSVLISVYCFHNTSIITLGIIISLAPIFVLILTTIFFFKGKYLQYSPSTKLFRVKHIKTIFGLGLKFIYIHFVTIMLYQTSNIIIAHNINQSAVTEYNIIFKYIGIISMIFSIIVTPFWSATTDAYTKKDFTWIKKSVRYLSNVRWILLLVGIVLVIVSDFILNLWIGHIFNISYNTLILALIYFYLQMAYSNYGMILNGMGKVYLQIITTSIVAAIYIPSAIILSENYGLVGIFLSLIIAGLLNLVWSFIQYKKTVNGTALGIWKK